MGRREYIEKMIKDAEIQIAKERRVATYKIIEERKRQLVCNMEKHYICIDDGQGGKIAMKKR